MVTPDNPNNAAAGLQAHRQATRLFADPTPTR